MNAAQAKTPHRKSSRSSAAFTIAIDGPAAAGKGSISRAIAAHFDLAHLDTGLLYRAVGAQVLTGSDPLRAAQNLTADDLQGDSLRSAEVARAASDVAVMPKVRAELLEFQRRFARREGGAVLDGRDIGTVIVPQAEVKLFVTAAAEVRAEAAVALPCVCQLRQPAAIVQRAGLCPCGTEASVMCVPTRNGGRNRPARRAAVGSHMCGGTRQHD